MPLCCRLSCAGLCCAAVRLRPRVCLPPAPSQSQTWASWSPPCRPCCTARSATRGTRGPSQHARLLARDSNTRVCCSLLSSVLPLASCSPLCVRSLCVRAVRKDVLRIEKRKKMLPWFCEEEYTHKPVGAVRQQHKEGGNRRERKRVACENGATKGTDRNLTLACCCRVFLLLSDSCREAHLSIPQASVRGWSIQPRVLRHLTRLHQPTHRSHWSAAHTIKLEARYSHARQATHPHPRSCPCSHPGSRTAFQKLRSLTPTEETVALPTILQ